MLGALLALLKGHEGSAPQPTVTRWFVLAIKLCSDTGLRVPRCDGIKAAHQHRATEGSEPT
jgi:hypothetical protein